MDPRLAAGVRVVRRRLRWHRRFLAAIAAGVAVLAGFSAYDASRSGVAVVVAATDLPAGRVLTDADVAVVQFAAASVAGGAIADPGAVVGRRLALPMRAREPVTDVRLLDGELLAALGPGLRAVPIRLADPGIAALVQPGARIDLFAATDSGAANPVTSAGVLVLQVLAADTNGVVVVVAADDVTTGRISAVAGTGFSVALRAPPTVG